MVRYHNINGQSVQFTAEEETARDAEEKAYADKSAERKLNTIKMIRLTKLQETDFYALKDVTMTDEMKTWRQSLRDIPANHTDEAAYDLLLARDASGNLTHSVWSKP
tara:strand:+ start:328 stop:648 length:321 start_codon:yes stop_codon:yes gene_type:complete